MAAFNATGIFQRDHPYREEDSSDPKMLDMSIRFRFEQLRSETRDKLHPAAHGVIRAKSLGMERQPGGHSMDTGRVQFFPDVRLFFDFMLTR